MSKRPKKKLLTNPVQYHPYTGDLSILPNPPFYDYIIARQGVFKRAGNPRFKASILIASGHIAGLDEWPFAGVDLLIPKIPAEWLLSVLAHARRAGDGIEQMYHFHYFDDERGWQVAVPRQDTSAIRVSYRGGDAPSIVLDLHSHHRMNAYFSGTDDQDEQGFRFYAVIGKIYSKPEIALRLGMWGDFLPLPVGALFEHSGPFVEV